MILFLDITGVLQPSVEFEADGSWRFYSGPKYVYAPRLLEALRPYLDQVEIVLSEWGAQFPDPGLMSALPDELATRVVDRLWLAGYEVDYRSDLATRRACIELWLKHRRPGFEGVWLSISDDTSGWPTDEGDCAIVGTGLLATEERRLAFVDRLRGLLPREK